MKEDDLNTLIEAERERSLPSCPANLEANVLRRIRSERSESGAPGPMGWLQGLLRPVVLLGLFTFTILLSTAASTLVASTYSSSVKTQERASEALDFGVFSGMSSFNLNN